LKGGDRWGKKGPHRQPLKKKTHMGRALHRKEGANLFVGEGNWKSLKFSVKRMLPPGLDIISLTKNELKIDILNNFGGKEEERGRVSHEKKPKKKHLVAKGSCRGRSWEDRKSSPDRQEQVKQEEGGRHSTGRDYTESNLEGGVDTRGNRKRELGEKKL